MEPPCGTQGLHLDHRHADALAQEVHVLAEVGASGVGQGDVERGAAHVHGNDVVDTERPRYRQPGLWCRGRTGVDRVDGALTHQVPGRQPAVGLEVAYWLLCAKLLEQVVDARHVTCHYRAEVGVDHGGGGAGVFANLREHLAAGADEHFRQGSPYQFGGPLFVAGVAHRPQEGNGHGLHAFGTEVVDGGMDGGFVQRAVLTAIAKDSATDRAAQVAWGKHVCRMGNGRRSGVLLPCAPGGFPGCPRAPRCTAGPP